MMMMVVLIESSTGTTARVRELHNLDFSCILFVHFYSFRAGLCCCRGLDLSEKAFY